MASEDSHSAPSAAAVGAPSNSTNPTVLTSERLQECTKPRRSQGVVEAEASSPQALIPTLSMQTSSSTEQLLPEEGSGVVWTVKKKAQKSMMMISDVGEAYTRRVSARCPCMCVCCGLLLILAASGVGVVLMPMELETNFDSFMKTDADVSRERDAFEAALDDMDDDRRLQWSDDGPVELYKAYNIYIAYKLKKSSQYSSILDVPVVTDIARFERSLFALEGWNKTCNRTRQYSHLCNPGLSVVNHMFPTLVLPTGESRNIVPDTIHFDGNGRDELFLPAMLHVAEHLDITDILFPGSFDESQARSVTEIRSAFQFKMFCCYATQSSSAQSKRRAANNENWESFLKDWLLPKLSKPQGEGSDESDEFPFEVYYDGTKLEEIEIMQTLMGDVLMAGLSMCFVFLYMVFHTGSGFLSVFALIIIFISIPLSYVVFALISGSREISLAMFLSLFLVVGLGSDVIFVYTDFWRDSIRIREGHADRLVYVIVNAGKASFATSSTTALSFIVNLVSVLKPLRQFGVFMGLCVMMVWLLVLLLYGPLCIIDETWLRQCNWQLWKSSTDKAGSSPTSEKEKSWRSTMLRSWAECLHPWRRCTVAFAVLAAVASLVSAAMVAKIDSGLPNLFPEDHNRNVGQQVLDNFRQLSGKLDVQYEGPSTKLDVCEESLWSLGYESCRLFWCQTEVKIPEAVRSQVELSQVEDGMCQCWQRDVCKEELTATQRFFGLDKSVIPLLPEKIAEIINGGVVFPTGVQASSSNMVTRELAPVLIQDWETGTIEFETVTELHTALQMAPGRACSWQSMCFCGTYICGIDEPWQPAPSFHLNFSTRRLVNRPIILRPNIPLNKQTVIDVIFGLEVDKKTSILGKKEADEMWSFSEDFELRTPWAQRNLYSFCTKLPEELLVWSKTCAIEEFRNWMVFEKRELYPVSVLQFDMWLEKFMNEYLVKEKYPPKEFFWMRGGFARGLYMVFRGDIDKNSAIDAIREYKKHWDKYVDAWNLNASVSATGAWHTARPWVRAEAQSELVSSTVLTLGLCAAFAFGSMLIFTMDVRLSLYVVCATLGVISGLTFFMLVLMGWAFGPIEVIALIVFIGYALDYSLHIAHKYSSSRALRESEQHRVGDDLSTSVSSLTARSIRFRRTAYALQSVGGAALGSAITTIGCSVFLILCTLTIFRKLGAVVLAVTLMSILMAFGPLTAVLFVAGPLHPDQNVEWVQLKFKRFRKAWSSTRQTLVQRQQEIRSSLRLNYHPDKTEGQDVEDQSPSAGASGWFHKMISILKGPQLLEEDGTSEKIATCPSPERATSPAPEIAMDIPVEAPPNHDAEEAPPSTGLTTAMRASFDSQEDGTLPPMPCRALTPRAQPKEVVGVPIGAKRAPLPLKSILKAPVVQRWSIESKHSL